jgi:hypothetical protein
MKYKPINIQRIKELLIYDPITGKITNKSTRGSRAIKGQEAGVCFESSGHKYRRIHIDGETYLAHRLAWALHYGEDPGELSVDHIDKDTLNNRIENLRLATLAEQNKNRRTRGILKAGKKWRARIYHEGKALNLGSFVCPLLARMAYEDKARELRGDWCAC